MAEPWEDPQDEIRELLDSISGKFKGGKFPSSMLLMVGLFLIALVGVLSSYYKVDPEEKAVVLRRVDHNRDAALGALAALGIVTPKDLEFVGRK